MVIQIYIQTHLLLVVLLGLGAQHIDKEHPGVPVLCYVCATRYCSRLQICSLYDFVFSLYLGRIMGQCRAGGGLGEQRRRASGCGRQLGQDGSACCRCLRTLQMSPYSPRGWGWSQQSLWASGELQGILTIECIFLMLCYSLFIDGLMILC